MTRCVKYKKWILCLCLPPCFISGPSLAGDGSAQHIPVLLAGAYNYPAPIAPTHDADPVAGEYNSRPETLPGSQTYFAADLALYDEKNAAASSKNGIEDWREQVFARLGGYERTAVTRYNDGPQSVSELNDRTGSEKKVKRMIVGETLKFIRNKSPIIDTIIRYLKVTVSTDSYAEKDPAPDRAKKENSKLRLNDLPANKQDKQERLSLQASLRFKLEDGGAGLIGQTEARYRKVSSFYTMHIDKRNNSVFGLKYPYDSNLHVEINHENVSASNPMTGEKINDRTRYNFIKLNLLF